MRKHVDTCLGTLVAFGAQGQIQATCAAAVGGPRYGKETDIRASFTRY